MKMTIFFLTCANIAEATNITRTLLEKKLIVCAKQFPVSSQYLWKGKIKASQEVFLIMDSKEGLFEKIEAEVKEIHSYETFVLTSVPVNKTTKKVKAWMKQEGIV